MQSGLKNFVAIGCFSYFVVFIIAGLWHGGTLEYFLYGVSHGLAFTIYLIYKKILEKNLTSDQLKWYKKNKVINTIAVLITFHYFYFSLFLFIHKMKVFSIIAGKL